MITPHLNLGNAPEYASRIKLSFLTATVRLVWASRCYWTTCDQNKGANCKQAPPPIQVKYIPGFADGHCIKRITLCDLRAGAGRDGRANCPRIYTQLRATRDEQVGAGVICGPWRGLRCRVGRAVCPQIPHEITAKTRLRPRVCGRLCRKPSASPPIWAWASSETLTSHGRRGASVPNSMGLAGPA